MLKYFVNSKNYQFVIFLDASMKQNPNTDQKAAEAAMRKWLRRARERTPIKNKNILIVNT